MCNSMRGPVPSPSWAAREGHSINDPAVASKSNTEPPVCSLIWYEKPFSTRVENRLMRFRRKLIYLVRSETTGDLGIIRQWSKTAITE